MKVIALQGRGNSGKTQTISILIDMILEHTECSDGKIELLSPKERLCFYDKECVFSYFGQKVAITTLGDDENGLNEWLKRVDFEFGEADIYICACHTRGKTLDFLLKRFGNENLILYGKNYISLVETKDVQEKNDIFVIKQQMNSNVATATEIFKIFNSLV